MEIFGIKFIPLNTPLKEHLLTLSALIWFIIVIFAGQIGVLLSVYLLIYTNYRWLVILYLIWIWVIDKDTDERGGRRSQWARSWILWKYLKEYFPLKFVKLEGVELDPKKNYLACGFPHGVLPAGLFNAVVYEASEYKTLCPHHTPYPITLKVQFLLPLSHDLMLSLGGISASSKSIEYVLSKPGGGNLGLLVVGGAKEAYYCKPGTYKVSLKDRKGFVKLALRSGSPLVPIFSFGETDLYDQVRGPILRRCQEAIKKWTTMAPVVPVGRGFFQYSFGLIPRKRPVTTVMGAPIEVPKIENPTSEQVDEYHAKFIDKLIELFEGQKYKYVEKPEETKLIIA